MSLHEFKPGDRVKYIGIDPPEMNGVRGTIDDRDVGSLLHGHVPVTWDDGALYHRTGEPASALMPLQPDPAPAEPTDEQRAAYWELHDHLVDLGLVHMLDALPFPDALTKPQPALPTEPGLYVGPGGTRGPVWRLDVEALCYDGSAPNVYREGGHDKATPADGPFTRLVLERPPVTAHDLWVTVGNSPTQSPIPDVYHRMAEFVNGTSR